MSVTQAVGKIRGPAGTTVTLQIVRGSQQLSIKIMRSNISIPSVTSKVVNGIGYLSISRFGDDTADLATQAAQNFQKQHVKGVVLDLRSDPGGLLQAAVSVSSLWVSQGKTILTERRDGVVTNTYTADGSDILAGLPTVVLIDGGSASASEITAGALHDNGVATLVGQQSYGKGSVQQIVQLGGGAILKVTVAHWYTPDGKNIDKVGITPDKKVAASTNSNVVPGGTNDSAANDPQLAAAMASLNQ
jgi:carboxyl-terminal processing protease